jgi:hypothetical protein
MATKTYLRKGPDGKEDWVTDQKDATAEDRSPIEVTQARLTSSKHGTQHTHRMRIQVPEP